MPSAVNRLRFCVLWAMAGVIFFYGCTLDDGEPRDGLSEPASIDEIDDSASVAANDLAEFATLVDATAVIRANLDDLTAGDRVRFRLPTPSQRVQQVFEIACRCAWSIEPPTAGGVDPPGGCTTVFTVLEAGSAVISVVQTCDGVRTGTFEQGISSTVGSAGVSGAPAGAPVADAGANLTVDEDDTVVLNGRNSFDPDGDVLYYDWAQTGGPSVTLMAPQSPIPVFVAPRVEEMVRLTFRLIVDDGQFTDEDEVNVQVMNVVAIAGLVTADAGQAQAISEGEVVYLSALGSSGTGIGVLTFTWHEVAGPPVVLTGADQAEASFTAPAVDAAGALLVFELIATDGEVSDSDTVSVTVFDDDPFLFDPATISPGAGQDGDPQMQPNENGDGDPEDVQDGDNENDNGNGDDLGNGNDNGADDGGPSTPGPGVFRGVYGSSNTAVMLAPGGPVDMLLEDGFEDFAIKLNSLRAPVGSTDRLRLRQWSQTLNAHGAKLWVFFNYFATLEHQWLLPLAEPYVGPDGLQVPLKPCPQSQAFWDAAITPRFVTIAELTDPDNPSFIPELATALRGVLLDPELYALADNAYRDVCYCDSCFAAFFALLGISDPVPAPADRLAYIEGANLVDDYSEFERGAVASRASACRIAFRAVNPALEIGGTNVIRFDRSPFYIGLADGLGTAQRPYYDWSQRTFWRGLDDTLAEFLQDIAGAGIHATILPGLLLPAIPPEAVADHYYALSRVTGGAWIDRSDNYGLQIGELCLPLEEYRQALVSAHAELNLLEADVNHVSPFTGEPFVPACLDPSPYNIGVMLEPLEAGPALAVGPLIRRETGYYFHAQSGASLSFDVSMREFGTSDNGSGWWQLVTPGGVVMDSAAITVASSPSLVRAAAPETGVYKLIINTSFLQGFWITNASHPGSYRVVLGNQRIGLFKTHDLQPEPQFYAYVPAGVTQVGIFLSASAGEASQVLIFDERNSTTPLFDELIDGAFEPTLDLGTNNSGVVLEFVIRNPPTGGAEDLNIVLTSGVLPYLSQTRSGLFREP